METLNEILELIPKLGIPALITYFVFVLFKVGSWIAAGLILGKLFITRWFNYLEKRLDYKSDALNSNANVKNKKYETKLEAVKLEIEYKKSVHDKVVSSCDMSKKSNRKIIEKVISSQ